MDPQNVVIEGGQVLANVQERTITGRLIPYGENGRTNQGLFMVEAGTIDLSEAMADPSVIGLNTDHVAWQGVGRATRVWEQPDGVYATWTIARTPAGDAALADAVSPTGNRRRLSGEFGPVMIRAGKLVPGHARLWGSALVPMGAFPSAMVLATDTPDPAPTPATHPQENTVPDPIVPTPAPAPAPAPAPVPTPAPEPAPAPAVVPAPAPVIVPAAAVVPASLPGAPVVPGQTQPVNETQQVLASIKALRHNPNDAAAMQVLAAITDITMSGANTLPGTNVLRPNWLGKLYQGIAYVREYAPLMNLGTDITAQGKLGMKVVRGTNANPLGPQDGTWAGNKQPINGYRGDSSTIGSLLYKFAMGNDIDRTLLDLPGGAEVVEEFLKLIIEDYLFWSDRIARETILLAAGNPRTNKAYPAIYNTNGTIAIAQLIQGILAVKARKPDQRRDQPTFAIANDVAFEQMAYAAGGDQNLPAFIQLALASLGLPQAEIGQIGPVYVVNGDTGIRTTSSVIVGAKLAIDFDELNGETPLTINAIDIARGGIDQATHGYFQTFTKRPEAIVSIGTPDAWAATTVQNVGDLAVNGAARLQAIQAGVTGAAAPANPGAVGGTVVDGTVVWKRVA